ncbi:MarR family winged helix-turn-helix transcriptional regulator [Sphingobacterium paucimobilis]|uniref:HTH marR-type domain-containing protein n=1 Tax=Sphingobacterium paucimobilis HER1398 TaxID=1346330 RepID=U2HV38_9SPHI|nr:MarR family winged helix-turn-helix transcriptional regulator [Sphingobacterium paucimobilis]ERJ59130.1 hypothetical protein M472_10130 [Sphingobacterium paucimobilis HER1398]
MNRSDFDLEQQNSNIESKIVASLERITQSFRVLLWRQSKEFPLTPTQIQLLIFLLHHDAENRKVSYLAQEFNMTKATISETVKTLEQKEFIVKEYEEQDTRSYTIHLTDKGREIARQTSLFTEEIRTPIDKLNDTSKETLLSSLLEIVTHLNQSGIISVQRMCINCSYYQSSDNGTLHYCRLLNQTLASTDLRIDCPEHQTKSL